MLNATSSKNQTQSMAFVLVLCYPHIDHKMYLLISILLMRKFKLWESHTVYMCKGWIYNLVCGIPKSHSATQFPFYFVISKTEYFCPQIISRKLVSVSQLNIHGSAFGIWRCHYITIICFYFNSECYTTQSRDLWYSV